MGALNGTNGDGRAGVAISLLLIIALINLANNLLASRGATR